MPSRLWANRIADITRAAFVLPDCRCACRDIRTEPEPDIWYCLSGMNDLFVCLFSAAMASFASLHVQPLLGPITWLGPDMACLRLHATWLSGPWLFAYSNRRIALLSSSGSPIVSDLRDRLRAASLRCESRGWCLLVCRGGPSRRGGVGMQIGCIAISRGSSSR